MKLSVFFSIGRPAQRARMASAALLAAALGVFAAPAFAGAPLVTEDADILGEGECEFGALAGRQHMSGEPAARFWGAQIGCGAGGWQAAAAYGQTDDGTSTPAAALSAKFGLVEREGSGIGVALAVAVAASGRSFDEHESLVNLAFSKSPVEDFTMHANLGWVHDAQAGSNSLVWALAAEHTFADGFDLTAEVYGDNHDRPTTSLGLRWSATDTLTFGAAWYYMHQSPGGSGALVTLTAAF